MSQTFNTKKVSNRNSLLELVKLAFAFMVLKGHGFTPLAVTVPGMSGDYQWFGSAGVAVEFFFCIAGWFLIRSIVSHQEKYGYLGLWRSWWKLFVKKLLVFAIPCLIPGIALNVITIFFHGGSPNGILWMYWYVHEMFLVIALYYFVFYKVKDENKRWKITLIFLIAGMIIRFAFRTFEILKSPIETFSAFWRALSFMSLGIVCAKIPKIKAKKMWLWIICFISIALAILGALFPIHNIWKEVIGVVTYPLVIYGCLLIDFHFKPFDYLGSLSKGLYLWQMIPYMFDVVGKYYSIGWMHSGWFLLITALVPMFIDDFIRRGYKFYRSKKENPAPSFAKAKTWWNNVYYTKGFYIFLLVLTASMFAAGLTLGICGLCIGQFKSFDWFVKDGKMTFSCAAMLSLIWLSLFPMILSVNCGIERKARLNLAGN